MYNASLDGTTSKIENVSIYEIKNWLNLVASSAVSSIDWDKVDQLGENKQITFSVKPYKLIIQHISDPVEPDFSEDPGYPSNNLPGGSLQMDLKVSEDEV